MTYVNCSSTCVDQLVAAETEMTFEVGTEPEADYDLTRCCMCRKPDRYRTVTAPTTLASQQSVADMAADSHALMIEHDAACRGHASIRNHALLRLADVYGLTPADIAQATGLPERTVRNAILRSRGKKTR